MITEVYTKTGLETQSEGDPSRTERVINVK
jgi:hypothetical protein